MLQHPKEVNGVWPQCPPTHLFTFHLITPASLLILVQPQGLCIFCSSFPKHSSPLSLHLVPLVIFWATLSRRPPHDSPALIHVCLRSCSITT
jgi:hypothetical protein